MDKQKKDNIVLFPKLKDRLVTVGMELLEKKKYKDAMESFEQLEEIDPSYKQVQVGIATCLFGMGRLEEAKTLCKRLLNEDIGEYYDILHIYLSILIQMHEYDEVIYTIEAILEENQLPSQHAEEFYRFLDFARRMTIEEDESFADADDHQQINDSQDIEKSVHVLLNHPESEEQWKAIQHLRLHSIDQVIPDLTLYLIDDAKHPVLKTMIVQLMMEQQVADSIVVQKFSRKMEIVPTELQDVFEGAFSINVLNVLEDSLANQNPSMFEITKQLWQRCLFVYYPFNPFPEREKLWAAALYKTGHDMTGFDLDIEEVVEQFDEKEKDILATSTLILQLEQESFEGIW